MTAAGDGLPDGWAVELDPQAHRTADGRALVGGAPVRVLRVTEAGGRFLDGVAAATDGLVPTSAGTRALAHRLVDAGLAVPRPTAPVRHTAADVAVVVPVLDDPDGLRATLATVGEVGEVIVVDDGSSDPDEVRSVVAEAGASSGVTATVLRNGSPQGPGAARQRGWRATDRPVVAFVDADVELPAGCLDPLLAHLDDPAVAAVAPRIRAQPGAAPGWLARYEAARFPLDLGPLAGPVRPGARVSYVPTATLLIRRDVLAATGGFDEALSFGEDVDLVWRLAEHGFGVRYEPAVEVRHPSRSSAWAAIRQRFAYGTSAAPLATRHGRTGAPLVLSAGSAATWVAVLLGRPVVAASIAGATTARLVGKLEGVDRPVAEAVRLAAVGHGHAAGAVADAVRRPWWPLALVLGWRVRRARPALLAAVVVPPLLERRHRRARLDPVRHVALRAVDDAAYGAGVWVGCWRERSVAALLPRLSRRAAT